MPATEKMPQAALVGARRRASEVLLALASATDKETVTLDDIVAAFGERAFGLVLILLGIVNMVPGPPGMSTVVGFPLFLVAMQMALGRPRPWLPQTLLKREFKREDLERLVQSAQPVLTRIESLCRPRMTGVFRALPEQALGVLAVLWAICVMIPLPLTNFPPSLATVIVSIALLEADGLLLLAGIGVGLVAISLTIAVTGSVAVMGVIAARTFFGF